MKGAFLVGPHTYLRPVEPEDAAVVAACTNDPDVRLSYFTHTPVSIALTTRRIQSFYEAGADYIPFMICVRETEKPIGVTALHRVDLVSHAAVFSICICDPDEWGRGYGGEVTRLMLKYSFEILNLHRVQLHVWADNEKGIRAYETAGFVREGVLREAMMHLGKYCDFLVMGILESEWRANQQTGPQPVR